MQPDSSVHFCIDFLEVNKKAKFDVYPMLRIDLLLDHVGEACYLTSVDLTKGYWHVPLCSEDGEKTAFATQSGLYQFTVMLFGLHGATTTFQQLVDRVLGSYWSFCVAYIDDILSFSRTWEEHLRHLHQVLAAIQETGLKVNPKKSVLIKTSMMLAQDSPDIDWPIAYLSWKLQPAEQ